MALALKTACCDRSLRTESIFLLYLYLFAHLLLFLENTAELDTSNCETEKDSTMECSSYIVVVFSVIFTALVSLLFFTTIITIHKEKPSLLLLNSVTWFLIIMVIYSAGEVIVENADGTTKNRFLKRKWQKNKANYTDQETFNREMTNVIRDEITLHHFILLPLFATQLYAALVFYSYRKQLTPTPNNSDQRRVNAVVRLFSRQKPTQFREDPVIVIPPQRNNLPTNNLGLSTTNYANVRPPPYSSSCK